LPAFLASSFSLIVMGMNSPLLVADAILRPVPLPLGAGDA
jgi:hypothetical protein